MKGPAPSKHQPPGRGGQPRVDGSPPGPGGFPPARGSPPPGGGGSQEFGGRLPAAPADTAEVLRTFNWKDCRNPGLVFERFAPDLSSARAQEAREKKAGLEMVRRCGQERELLQALLARRAALAKEHLVKSFTATTRSRLVVGLGRKGTYEVGLSFHRIYGVPYIPGSALKGIARSYASLVLGKAEKDPELQEVFGVAIELQGDREPRRVDRAGEVVFWDAFPEKPVELDLDVMNPHYPEYYGDTSGRTPPSNWQDPVPVYFLTVATGTPFRVTLSTRRTDAQGQQRLGLASQWLREGLSRLGAGAKTSSGYGYFLV